MLEVADGSEGPEDSSHRNRLLMVNLNQSIYSDLIQQMPFESYPELCPGTWCPP